MIPQIQSQPTRRKVVWGPKRLAAFIFGIAVMLGGSTRDAAAERRFPRLEFNLETRAISASSLHTSRVIVTLVPGGVLPAVLQGYDHTGRLDTINGHILDVPDSVLATLATSAGVQSVHQNRPVVAMNFRNGITSGTFFARYDLGYTGAGVGIAVLDSGAPTQHDDLRNIVYFQNFVDASQYRADNYGHGTHVTGIIAGSGADSGGQYAGAAPGASIVSLKVLDAQGNGSVDNVLAALEWVSKNYQTYNIKVVNLSIGAAVTESYNQDPLAIAAKKLVDLGITVVAAAGNHGSDQGSKVWGAISSPANAPWVLTVGASSTQGTLTRKDDAMARFSSRGPTLVDRAAKPDLLASGVGTVSTISREGSLTVTQSQYLLPGTAANDTPYMSLSGTSMAAPLVSGTVALMLQANPNLTPNLIKAILQYTAEPYAGYDVLEQGAGFLNALGAVRLAKFYAANPKNGDLLPSEPIWSRQIIWGNHRLTNGVISPQANAWKLGVRWGAVKTLGDSGDNIVWGNSCGGDCGDNIVWGNADGGDNIVWGNSDDGDNIVWGNSDDGDNIVWGNACGGADCTNIIWGVSDGDNIVWGNSDGDNIVWGNATEGDNIVWGNSDDGDNIVWGNSDDGDNIVWGNSDDGDNIVWGNSDDGDNIVWGNTGDGDNVVWGTLRRSAKRIVSRLNPSFRWFLTPTNDAAWIEQEFGDTFVVSANGRP